MLRQGLLLMLFSLFFLMGKLFSQKPPSQLYSLFEDIEINVDTSSFTLKNDVIEVQGKKKIPFLYTDEETIVEILLYPSSKKPLSVPFRVVPSSQFSVLDSLTYLENSYYRLVIKYKDIHTVDFHSVTFIYGSKDSEIHLPLRLLPFANTTYEIHTKGEDFYVGEEKKLEILSNRPENIKIDPQVKSEIGFEYRLERLEGSIFLNIMPTSVGNFELELQLLTKNPFLDVFKELSYELPVQTISFSSKGSRLDFLKLDVREVIKEKGNRKGVEVQIESSRKLEINKTYRIEDTDEKGGPLVAELYTVRRLSNDRVLCMLRPYLLHTTEEGYLFVKDGDEPVFITNVDILPEAKVNKVSILREGGSWTQSTNIYPGETFEIRMEGKGLQKTSFIFDGLRDVSKDTMVRNGQVVHYLLQVPIDIRKKSVAIFNQKKNTGINLDVQEFMRPRELDFVTVEYNQTPRKLTSIHQPVLHNGTIGDVVFSFETDEIDFGKQLFGKQHLEIEVVVKGRNNNLIEMKTIDNILVCPDETSPRYSFYKNSGGNCTNEKISLNDYLSTKTHSLENWGKIEFVVKHQKNRYGGDGYTERFTIIKQKVVTFDVDLSIPAGLIIKKVGVDGFPGLSGISLSMLAQFSFYKKDEIQKLRPFKIGAGFLAQNAFNFNPDADRDLGIVILGSVYPTRKERKFTFPLYAGFGYFLNEERFFYLIGPGIRINF